jgi:hypothetical protein
MLLSPSTDLTSPSCASSSSSSSEEALLQIIFNTTTSSSSSTAVRPAGGMRVSVTFPSNGTILDSFAFKQGDILRNLTACLSRSGCYALELINFWKGYYQIIYDGSFLTDSTVEFPYYVTSSSPSQGGNNSNLRNGSSSNLHNGSSSSSSSNSNSNNSSSSTEASPSMSMMTPDDDNHQQQHQQQQSFEPYESNLTFVALTQQQQQQQGSASSSSSFQCIPQCDLSTEDLYEVQIYGGSYGDGALSWRIEQDDNGQGDVGGGADQLMGCEDDDASGEAYEEGAASSTSTGRCGTVNGVRLQRACLPKSGTGCRRFVMGHPNRVPSEGSAEVYDDDHHHHQQQQQQPDRWVGHYHPSFKVSVDGLVAAGGTSATFASADIVTDGNGNGSCSEGCNSGGSLLEIFRYRTAAPLRYSLRDLHTLDVVLRSSNSSSGDNVLGYERQCVPAFRCYDLTFTSNEKGAAASASNSSIGGGISTQVVLGGTYYANTVVRDHTFRVILGERCERQEACSSEQSLVQVEIDTGGEARNASQPVPGYNYCAWSVLDERYPPNASRLPQESTAYFSNGYSGGSMFRHYACVPDLSSSLSFAMLNSVPSDVTWSLERNGVVLGCREHCGNHSAPFRYLDDYILTPLDGSCRHSPTVASRASSSSGSMSTGLIVGIVLGILVSMAFLAVAVFYSGGEEERSRRRSNNSNNNNGGAGGAAAAASSNRSTGTVCESDVAWSDDDDEGDCGP